ncbi:MAG: hypothetical protein AB1810_03585 [Pseudomonadota bacterium]
MSRLPADSVSIHRLRIVHWGEMDRARRQQATARLRQQIEWSDWPEAPDQSWVFIRQVRAQAPAERLALALTSAVRDLVRSGGAEEVVRFANLTELLAALLTDLLQGQAAQRWYWQRWAHLFELSAKAPAQSVVTLLAEHLDLLPAVCARLAQQRSLERLWLSLDSAGAVQLMAELAWRHGIRLPPLDELAKAADSTAASRHETRASLRLSRTLQQRWAPILNLFTSSDPRRLLALLLLGQEAAPMMLRQAPLTLLAQLDALTRPARPVSYAEQRADRATPPPARFGAPSAATPGSTPETPDSMAPVDATSGHAPAVPVGVATHEPEVPVLSSERYPRRDGQHTETTAERGDVSAMSPTAVTTSHEDPAPSIGTEEVPPQRPPQAVHSINTSRDPAFERFHTQQGGLLYLLNLLNRPEVRVLLEDFWEHLPNGWGWLYRLGQELQLDETDPLVAYIAVQLGFDHPEQLAELPPLPAREQLLALAQRWYGRAGLWTPGLLRLDARVQADPSHVDLYAPLSAVQLPVRLAGLDINPGWLPWLGRVVNFHYE